MEVAQHVRTKTVYGLPSAAISIGTGYLLLGVAVLCAPCGKVGSIFSFVRGRWSDPPSPLLGVLEVAAGFLESGRLVAGAELDGVCPETWGAETFCITVGGSGTGVGVEAGPDARGAGGARGVVDGTPASRG